jgi:hypothetical protein
MDNSALDIRRCTPQIYWSGESIVSEFLVWNGGTVDRVTDLINGPIHRPKVQDESSLLFLRALAFMRGINVDFFMVF